MDTTMLSFVKLIFVTLFALLFIQSCGNDDNSNSTPSPAVSEVVEACFQTNIDGGFVSFNSNCSKLANEWQWDFGDGSSSIAQNPSHTYNSSGSFTVTLKVTSADGSTNTVSNSISIQEVCKTCRISVLGQSVSTPFCGTRQQAEDFCRGCTTGGVGTSSCN